MQEEKVLPTLDDVYNIYSKYVPVDIKSNTRLREVVDYRVFFFKLCLDYTTATNTKIASFANRHHSTVNHYVNNFDSFSLNNKKAYNVYVRVEKELIEKFPVILGRYEETPEKIQSGGIPKTLVKQRTLTAGKNPPSSTATRRPPPTTTREREVEVERPLSPPFLRSNNNEQ